MLDFSVIKNEKLRALIEESKKFKQLTEYQQEKHIEKLKDLPPEQAEKVCEFFIRENTEEKSSNLTNEEKLEVLNRLYDELVELEQKFTHLLKQEPENKQRNKDDKTMNNLLDSLNNS